MARLIALVIAGVLLTSCAGMPYWAGGLPPEAPPRPGTPEYDAFRQKLDAEAARDKRKDSPKSNADNEKKGLLQF